MNPMQLMHVFLMFGATHALLADERAEADCNDNAEEQLTSYVEADASTDAPKHILPAILPLLVPNAAAYHVPAGHALQKAGAPAPPGHVMTANSKYITDVGSPSHVRSAELFGEHAQAHMYVPARHGAVHMMADESAADKAARERANDPEWQKQQELLEKGAARRDRQKKKRGWFDPPEQCESDWECDKGQVCCDVVFGKICFDGNFCFGGGRGEGVKPGPLDQLLNPFPEQKPQER